MPLVQSASQRQEELAKVAAIKAKVGPAAFRFSDKQLLRLVDMCGSTGLACDCLLLIPRPYWLERWEAEAPVKALAGLRLSIEEATY